MCCEEYEQHYGGTTVTSCDLADTASCSIIIAGGWRDGSVLGRARGPSSLAVGFPSFFHHHHHHHRWQRTRPWRPRAGAATETAAQSFIAMQSEVEVGLWLDYQMSGVGNMMVSLHSFIISRRSVEMPSLALTVSASRAATVALCDALLLCFCHRGLCRIQPAITAHLSITRGMHTRCLGAFPSPASTQNLGSRISRLHHNALETPSPRSSRMWPAGLHAGSG